MEDYVKELDKAGYGLAVDCERYKAWRKVVRDRMLEVVVWDADDDFWVKGNAELLLNEDGYRRFFSTGTCASVKEVLEGLNVIEAGIKATTMQGA